MVQCPAPPADHWHLIDGYNNTYTCVRTLAKASRPDGNGGDEGSAGSPNSLYCEFADDEHFIEYYDHTADPWQLKNLARATPPPAALKPLKKRLQELRTCKGKACRPL